MGGKLTPEFPLKLKDDGITNMYSHNLQAWNMFRNLSLGCSVDDTNFASTEASGVPNGNGATNSYQAMPVRRVYGTWVANGNDAYDESKYSDTKGLLEWKASEAGGTVQFTHTVPTLSFIPDNVNDIPLVEMGMRCKMGVSADIATEESATDNSAIDIAGTVSGYTNLDKTTLGLDRFFKTTSSANATQMGTNNDNLVNGKNVMYAGAPCNVAWAHSAGKIGENPGTKLRDAVSALGVPFCDGQRRPILSKETGF